MNYSLSMESWIVSFIDVTHDSLMHPCNSANADISFLWADTSTLFNNPF